MELSSAVGGSDSQTYQLYYKGEPLPMDSTVKELTAKISNLKSMLGIFFRSVENKTLNQLCESFGQEWIQDLIDKNS